MHLYLTLVSKRWRPNFTFPKFYDICNICKFSMYNFIKSIIWYNIIFTFFSPKTGSWVDDQRCGFGKYFYINSDTYEGEWLNHVRHGQGTYTYATTGTKYIGTWNGGKRDGHGELVHANHKYVGVFKEDRVSDSHLEG